MHFYCFFAVERGAFASEVLTAAVCSALLDVKAACGPKDTVNIAARIFNEHFHAKEAASVHCNLQRWALLSPKSLSRLLALFRDEQSVLTGTCASTDSCIHEDGAIVAWLQESVRWETAASLSLVSPVKRSGGLFDVGGDRDAPRHRHHIIFFFSRAPFSATKGLAAYCALHEVERFVHVSADWRCFTPSVAFAAYRPTAVRLLLQTSRQPSPFLFYDCFVSQASNQDVFADSAPLPRSFLDAKTRISADCHLAIEDAHRFEVVRLCASASSIKTAPVLHPPIVDQLAVGSDTLLPSIDAFVSHEFDEKHDADRFVSLICDVVGACRSDSSALLKNSLLEAADRGFNVDIRQASGPKALCDFSRAFWACVHVFIKASAAAEPLVHFLRIFLAFHETLAEKLADVSRELFFSVDADSLVFLTASLQLPVSDEDEADSQIPFLSISEELASGITKSTVSKRLDFGNDVPDTKHRSFFEILRKSGKFSWDGAKLADDALSASASAVQKASGVSKSASLFNEILVSPTSACAKNKRKLTTPQKRSDPREITWQKKHVFGRQQSSHTGMLIPDTPFTRGRIDGTPKGDIFTSGIELRTPTAADENGNDLAAHFIIAETPKKILRCRKKLQF